MKIIIHIFVFSFFIFHCGAQQTTFQKAFGGTENDYDGSSVQQTADGGYIIAGTTWSFTAGYSDVYLIKADAGGDTLWTKTFGGTNNEYVSSVQQTTDGGYIIAALTHSFGAGGGDVYLIKTNAGGDTLWTKTFGGNWFDWGHSVQQTSGGGYIIAGYTSSFGAGGKEVYLIKTDVGGDILWTKTFGGTSDEYGNSVQQTADGGYVIAGSTFSFDADSVDVYLIKTDISGDTLWTKTFGGTDYDDGNSVLQSSDGGYIIAGTTYSFGAGNNDLYLIKTDSGGETLWTKTFGGADYEEGNSVQQTADGGYVIVGTITYYSGSNNSDIYLIKTDSGGNTLWTKTLGGNWYDWGRSVHQTTDGGYVIVGHTYSFGAGYRDIYLIKTDSNGNSGCNVGNPAIIVTSPSTIVGNPNTQVSSGGVVGNPATQTGSGGVVTTICSTVGLNENNLSENEITIFPNPNSGKFNVQSSEFKVLKIEIYNLMCEKVLSKTLNSKLVTLNLSEARQGIYFCKVTSENGRIAVEKIIIQ